MPILSTKDYSAAKFNKIQRAFGRRLGLDTNASANQIESAIEQWIRDAVREQDDVDYYAQKPVPDNTF